ncbi:unnamed protein product [Phaedon cochleariae]|uniref:Tetratricopeptide repeat protein 12 n=1 Tax=Phaedon cochleariae TaxID=80249 RepID=A0A9P0GKY3_PHACE|nr:unnamed protein product [Phaedon cochleariae]
MENPRRTEKIDEEFNNFMLKVNEVESIVKKLASKDKQMQKIGNIEAEKYLEQTSERVVENIDSEETILTIKTNRTVINKKCIDNANKDRATLSQEAFMGEVSRDADKRYKDKLVRKEKMETFKKQANLAFRRGEFEKSLILYDKAIDQIKDSCLLYNNRALTCINLGLYQRAKEDLKWALRLNEDCLKSWLLLAKVHFQEKNHEEFAAAIKEAIDRNPRDANFIKEYAEDLEKATRAPPSTNDDDASQQRL